jgi:hypothetical protein
MPFTFVHPAIILPLNKSSRWFSMTGLVIGSMIPDFEYFLRMKIQSDYSHTITGLLWFDFPLSILLAFVFHNIVKMNLINNLPKFLQYRFLPYQSFCWNEYFRKNWLKIIISILIGIFSHLLWDSFTHISGYFVEHFPLLKSNILIFGYNIPIFKILQHGSTVLGCLFILFFVYKMPKISNIHKFIRMKYWFVFGLFTLLIIVLKMCFGLKIQQYGNFVTTIISATIISLIITSLLFISKSKN